MHHYSIQQYILHRPWSDETKKRYGRNNNWLAMAIALFIAMLIVASLTGCKSHSAIQAPHPSSARTTQSNTVIHDSILVDRYHTKYIKGDTVFLHDSIFKSNTKMVHDTLHTTDTIRLPEYIQQDLTARQRFFIKSGQVAWFILGMVCLICIIIVITAFFLRRR